MMNKRIRCLRKARKEEIPEYSLEFETKEKPKIPKWIRNTVAITIFTVAVLYLPPIFFHNEETSSDARASIKTDITAILQANNYLKNNPESDFDKDGLSNDEESRLGTDPFRVDTDGDGIIDYAEYTLTKTSPVLKNDDVLINIIQEQTQKAEKSVNSPIKINDVILWPNDIQSRAYGTIVRAIGGGYRLYNFSGWAQFPEGEYVYQVKNERHYALKVNSNGAAYISGPDTYIEVYEQPLEYIYELTVCGHPVYLNSVVLGDLLCFILPDQAPAILRCSKTATIDFDSNTVTDTEVEIQNVEITFPESRFSRNQILLTDLARIRKCIEENETILTSLYSPINGEAIVLVYGYTACGNLLIADPQTGESLGELKIQERASRLYDERGQQIQYEWFTFEGLGFSSFNKDRISFFSVPINTTEDRS